MLAVTGITNKSPRALMTGLLDGTDYTTNQAGNDLARLPLSGTKLHACCPLPTAGTTNSANASRTADAPVRGGVTP